MWANAWLTVLTTSFEFMIVSTISDSLAASPLPSPTPSNSPQDSPGSVELLWLWILLGVLGGGLLLFGIIVILIIIMVITVKKKKKSYTINSNSQSVHTCSTSGVSQIKSMKYHRGNSTNRSTSINSHVTVGRTESGQHKHMQVVNRGYLLASNEPHTNDRVATQKRPMKPRVALSSKPREEQEEDYDSDYSEVAITTKATNTTEAQASMSMSIHQNVAYDLDEDDIATVNSVRQAALFGGSVKGGGVPLQVKKPPAVKVKPKRMTSSSSSSIFEASVTYDAPKSYNRPICLEDSTISMYDVVRREYGGEIEAATCGPKDIPQQQSNEPQYSNTSSSVRGSIQDRSGVYYNQRDLELMKHAEVLYGNLKEDSVPDYENLKKDSDTGEVLYGNLNQDAEENEYYNQRAIMESRASH